MRLKWFCPTYGALFVCLTFLFWGRPCLAAAQTPADQTPTNQAQPNQTPTNQAQPNQAQPNQAQQRQAKLMKLLPDGLIILPAESVEKKMEQPFWVQDPSFFYFTTLSNAPGSILLIDAPKNRSILFSGADPTSFGIPLTDLNITNRPDWIEKSGVSAVLPNSEFETYIRSRMNEGVSKLYLDGPRRAPTSEVPSGMLEVSGFHRLWEQSFRNAFPTAEFHAASDAIDVLMWVKSPGEIEQLRKNAQASANALKRGMASIMNATYQREAEAAVVAECLESGAEGPSFWPWVMTGPNAHIQQVVRSFYDPQHLNRAFESGEVVRVDVGCAGGGYGGDVGRTVPVSGEFTSDQAVIWDALVAGYLAGIDVMKDGVSLQDVEHASQNGLIAWRNSHPESHEMVEYMLGPKGVSWHLHGVGIESGETPQPVLKAGSVIAFEPMFSFESDAFYLEDMILIGSSGVEILTPGLPYWADEMSNFLRHAK